MASMWNDYTEDEEPLAAPSSTRKQSCARRVTGNEGSGKKAGRADTTASGGTRKPRPPARSPSPRSRPTSRNSRSTSRNSRPGSRSKSTSPLPEHTRSASPDSQHHCVSVAMTVPEYTVSASPITRPTSAERRVQAPRRLTGAGAKKSPSKGGGAKNSPPKGAQGFGFRLTVIRTPSSPRTAEQLAAAAASAYKSLDYPDGAHSADNTACVADNAAGAITHAAEDAKTLRKKKHRKKRQPQPRPEWQSILPGDDERVEASQTDEPKPTANLGFAGAVFAAAAVARAVGSSRGVTFRNRDSFNELELTPVSAGSLSKKASAQK